MKIFVLSMGCAKNTADSEHLIALLKAAGHEIIDEAVKADAAIINTCGFILDAVKENIDAILDLEELKNSGKIKKLIVLGCLVNRYEKNLREEFSSVDLFARSEEWEKIIKFLGGDFNQNCKVIAPAIDKRFWSRYLKVSEGCNTLCSYCAIPLIRGRLRSVPLKNLIDEALMLCAAGAKELCLVGQDLTVYGADIDDENINLKTLIHELDRELPKGTWLRLLYLHPNRVNEDLIDFLMSHEKVLHYLDIPIQHVDSEILKAMNRPCPEGHMEKIFKYIRGVDDLFTLRTTIMTGFPGETRENFEKVLDFLSEIEFDHLGVFSYSREEGTPAAKLKKRVLKEIAEQRCSEVLNLQSEIASQRSSLFDGRELEILIERFDRQDGELVAVGRSFRDAPEIDGVVLVDGFNKDKLAKKFKPGDVIRAKIESSIENDLFGKVID
ncbi:MAG: 30S ribosomal protein S12 methylthiotransferase RimO [Synergistaceae bacterium]|nr:30S ribosomal protein S12 methylthiotransferase RimO [Synergistaceae bacterium]